MLGQLTKKEGGFWEERGWVLLTTAGADPMGPPKLGGGFGFVGGY